MHSGCAGDWLYAQYYKIFVQMEMGIHSYCAETGHFVNRLPGTRLNTLSPAF